MKDLIAKIKAAIASLKLDGQDTQELETLLASAEGEADKLAKATDKAAADLAKAKGEAAAKAEKIAELEAKVASAGDVDKRVTELETLLAAEKTARREAEEATKRERILNAVRDKVSTVGIPDGKRSTALKLLELSLDGVTLDDAGAVVGLEAKLEALKSDHGHLFEPDTRAKGNGGAGDKGAPPPTQGNKPADKPGDDEALARKLLESRGLKWEEAQA